MRTIAKQVEQRGRGLFSFDEEIAVVDSSMGHPDRKEQIIDV